MTNTISIRPSKELRNNYAQISNLSRQNPVAITVNGKEDVYSHLTQASDDIRLGRVQNIDDACDDILKDLEGINA